MKKFAFNKTQDRNLEFYYLLIQNRKKLKNNNY